MDRYIGSIPRTVLAID